jgi:DNA primase
MQFGHRADSKLIRSAKAWQLVYSYTHLQDVPSGRFKIVAYSPKSGIEWSLSRQDTEQALLESMIPELVETLQGAASKVQALMIAADEAAEQRRQEWEAEWERYRRQEDKRKSAEALLESHKQLAQLIEQWAKVMAVEQFFREAENRLFEVAEESRPHLEARLALARKMVGNTDPFQFLASWVSPDERDRSSYDGDRETMPETPGPAHD